MGKGARQWEQFVQRPCGWHTYSGWWKRDFWAAGNEIRHSGHHSKNGVSSGVRADSWGNLSGTDSCYKVEGGVQAKDQRARVVSAAAA